MIKINNKDSIIDIIKKIESCKNDKVVLEFPIWNTILHNYTSLKLLKNKAWDKELIIITNDINAKKIWKRLGIKYSLLNDKNAIKNIDLLKYNYTFWEYFIFLIKSYIKEFKGLFCKVWWNKNIFCKNKQTKEKSRLWLFLIWLFSSLFLLFFIFYFAVNETYIKIVPEITIKTKAKNFIFTEKETTSVIGNDNIIKLTPISKLVYLEETFWTTWIKEWDNTKSKWKVTLYNHLSEDIALLNNSRLETATWILYTIDWGITIPKAYEEDWNIIPWTIDVNVTSKNYDSSWKFTWEKANIGTWITLTFPWLSDMSRTVYAKSIEVFTGWTNNYTKIIGEDDIENAKLLLEEKLKSYALEELKKQIKQENQTNNITYEILWIDKIIEYSNLDIKNLENVKIWDEKENFKLDWTIQIDTYIFNKELVISKLKNSIRESLLEDVEKINYINDDSLRLSNIIYQYSSPFEAKITSEIEVFYSLNFQSNTNQYLEKLKDKIMWLDINEAKKYY